MLFSGPEAHDAYFAAADDQLDPRPVYQFTVPIFGRGVAYDVAPEIMTEQLGFLFPALRESAMRRFARIMFEEASLFADPDQFAPDRFAPPRSEEKQHPYALIGFGSGKHRCMGKNFAILQFKALWSVLFDRFDFTLATPVPTPNYGSWVTGPKLPYRVRYRRRPEAGVIR